MLGPYAGRMISPYFTAFAVNMPHPLPGTEDGARYTEHGFGSSYFSSPTVPVALLLLTSLLQIPCSALLHAFSAPSSVSFRYVVAADNVQLPSKRKIM